ncbi:hypothetical protein EDD22DRAFT_1008725 [Suillus occidentalis]|nr:hypothetical protein EDD22DRAFT_1008725 [Suillus occidentalis]
MIIPPLIIFDVLPWFGPEPQFKPNFWSGSPWFGPWFSHQPESDRKTVLGSRSTQMVPFWFSLPEPFRTLLNFYFDIICLNVKMTFGICTFAFLNHSLCKTSHHLALRKRLPHLPFCPRFQVGLWVHILRFPGRLTRYLSKHQMVLNGDTSGRSNPVSSVNLDMFPSGIYRDLLRRSIHANQLCSRADSQIVKKFNEGHVLLVGDAAQYVCFSINHWSENPSHGAIVFIIPHPKPVMHEIRLHSIHSSWLSLIHYQVGHTDWLVLLINLTNQLSTHFDHRGNAEDLSQANTLQSEALALHSVGHPDPALHPLFHQ